jgi:hypothetical protein
VLSRALRCLLAVTVLVGCADSIAPGMLTLAAGPTSRSTGIHQDSTVLTPDSALVIVRGEGGPSAHWTASHGSGSWLTLVTVGGSGSDVLRWVVNAEYLAPGTYVDTIRIAVPGATGSPARIVDSLTVRGAPAQLVGVRRAWLPGERAATIALWQRNGMLVIPFAGDVSYLADQMLDRDSVTLIVANPLYRTAGSGPARAPQFAAGWGIIGFQVFQVDQSSVPNDTLAWNGVKWWNPADSTWVGMLVKATPNNTYGLFNVSTAAFDSSGGRSGAGGGEAQQATGTYWEANAGAIHISFNNNCGTATTVSSGVYKGGTVTVCQNGGRIVGLSMPRVTGTASPATATLDFDWRTARITGFRFTCVFPSPCTGAAAPPARPGPRPGSTVRELLMGMR